MNHVHRILTLSLIVCAVFVMSNSTDLAPGEKTEVQLIATSTDFNGWTAHPEVESGEHSHGGEDNRESKNEHN